MQFLRGKTAFLRIEMAVGLEGFRALVAAKAAEVRAVGTKDGYELHALNGNALHTDAGRVRVFKNLSTLARFAKVEGVNSLLVDLTLIPKPKKTAFKAVSRVGKGVAKAGVKKSAAVAS